MAAWRPHPGASNIRWGISVDDGNRTPTTRHRGPRDNPVGPIARGAATSEGCDLTLVLFDEIEKAAPSLAQLLLGVLDKATLRLGDGMEVNFERALIFLTSNLGARDMLSEIQPGLGFDTRPRRPGPELAAHLERVGLRAVQRHFSPEFVNRIDAVITYRPLGNDSLVAILEQHVVELQRHVQSRLGSRSFDIEVAPPARFFMLDKGTSVEYGARELRRIIHRHLTQPLAAMVANGQIDPGAVVTVDLHEDGERLTLAAVGGMSRPAVLPATVLAVDDNDALLGWLQHMLSEEGHRVLVASTVQAALDRVEEVVPDILVVAPCWGFCLPEPIGPGPPEPPLFFLPYQEPSTTVGTASLPALRYSVPPEAVRR